MLRLHRRYGEVAVLEESETIVRIVPADTPESEHELRATWVKRADLSEVPIPKAPRAGVSLTCAIPDLDYSMPFVDLVYAIQGDYRLEVYTKHDFIDHVEYQYLEWADELLPESAIHVYENRPTPFCWRLFFPLPTCAKVPFPIEPMGISGRRPTGKPRGLLHDGHVDVYFTELVEKFVRAGLRATI